MTVDRRYVWPLALFGLLAVVGGVALGWGEAGVLWGSGTAMQAPASQAETAPIAFSDDTEEAGLGAFRHETGAVGNKWFPETMGAGSSFIDYNGDGHLDVLLVGGGTCEEEPAPPGHRALWLYRNDGDGTFTEATTEVRMADDVPGKTLGVVELDYDRDGWPDLAVANDMERRVRAGSSYMSQNEKTVTFGLGQASRVDSLAVHWPSGRVDRFEDLEAGQTLRVVEGATTPRVVAGAAPAQRRP